MKTKKSKNMNRLLVVAHPDDESIFFAGLIMQLRDLPWHVICLTDGNFTGRGKERHQEFLKATSLLKVKTAEHWNYPDAFPNRLPVNEIAERLKSMEAKEIFTHGPMGEYGHPHHQDTCLAVHRAFPNHKIFSPAWNCKADKVITLTPKQFALKTKIFGEVYAKETNDFLNILPNMSVETFAHFTHEEAETVVSFLRKESELKEKQVKELAWINEKFPALREKLAVKLY